MRVVEIIPVLVVEIVPALVVEIVPALVVEIVPALVVEMVPVFPNAAPERARINRDTWMVDLSFMGFTPGALNFPGVYWSVQRSPTEQYFGPTKVNYFHGALFQVACHVKNGLVRRPIH